MDDRKERIMDDQTEVPPVPDTETWPLCGQRDTSDGSRCLLDQGHPAPCRMVPEPCGERDEDGGGCLNRSGHDGLHESRDHLWSGVALRALGPCELPDGHDGDHRDQGHHYPADGEVSWPPREWKTPTWATVTDLVAQVAGLTSTVRTLTEQTRILRQRLDAQEQRIHGLGRRAGELEKDREERMGHAGPAANRADLSALRCQIDEQASLTRKHVTVMLTDQARTFSIALDGVAAQIQEAARPARVCGVPAPPGSPASAVWCLLMEGHEGSHDSLWEGSPVRWSDDVPDLEPGPCTATAQSPTGLVSCTQNEGHTGSHTNALAVWSDAPPMPQDGVYEVY